MVQANSIQVVGDSLSKRLEFYVQHNTNYSALDFKIAKSGARIKDIKSILKHNRSLLHPQRTLVIWIGTNDIFSNATFDSIRNQFVSLVRYIRRSHPMLKIVILDLPIFPRAKQHPELLEKLEKFNAFLHTLVSSTTTVPFTKQVLNSNSFFQTIYPNSCKQDGIHLNNKGNGVLVQFLRDNVF